MFDVLRDSERWFPCAVALGDVVKTTPRRFRIRAQALIAGSVILFCAGAGYAADLTDLVPPPPSDGACWERSYSDGHLSRHPRQKVTEVRLLLQEWRGELALTIDIATRERAGTVTGTCHAGSNGSATCRIACDDGELSLRRSGGQGALLVEIGVSGRLHVNARCAGDDGAEPFVIDAQPDDAAFLLHPTSVRTCTVQPFKPFLDHRGG